MLIDWESGKKFIEGSVVDPDPLHPKIIGLLDPDSNYVFIEDPKKCHKTVQYF
jgi:hypothetical protein